MMTAPSWSAVRGAKIDCQQLLAQVRMEHDAASRRCPPEPVSRSMTMSAPVRDAASEAAVRASVRGTVSSASPRRRESAQPSEPTRPMRSRPRRSSGWKMTTSASSPTTAPVWRMPDSSRRSSAWATT